MTRTKRHAVYLCKTANGFRPEQPWDLPTSLLTATLLQRACYYNARKTVHQVNRDALEAIAAGTWDGTWAILGHHVKPRRAGGAQ